MEFIKALSLHLGGLEQPVVTDYDFCVIVIKLFAQKTFRNEPITCRRKNHPDRHWCDAQLKELLKYGVLDQHKNFPAKKVFRINGKKEDDAGDVACSVDPFAYVSHLSAMAYHGITDILPNILFLSSPDHITWSKHAIDHMKKDLCGDYLGYCKHKLPKLKRLHFDKINKFPVVRISSKHHGAFKTEGDRKFRVATIGRTFLDMVREPEKCGGIPHVVDVFRNHGDRYRNLIIDEVDQHGNKIEKVRAGYLLEEISNVKDRKIEKWLECVQRGGSRKLNPNEEYSSDYNERWCLSINMD